jgi:hypothetical protein
MEFEKRVSGIKDLTIWILAHIFLWGVTLAIVSTAKLSLHLFIADIINPFICSLEISDNYYGSTYTIRGIDFGLLIGQLISFLVAFLFGGFIAGLGEWRLVKVFFNIPVKERNTVVIFIILAGLVASFLVNFFAMCSGIINVIIGVNHSIATFVTGLFFGGLFGVLYGIIVLLICNQGMSRNLSMKSNSKKKPPNTDSSLQRFRRW